MKASPEAQKELLKIQALDNRAQQLDHTLKNLSQLAEITVLNAELDSIRQRHSRILGELEDAQAEITRMEGDVELVETRIKRNAVRADQSASAKDAQALETELASLKKRRFDLEEIEISIMERVEGIETTLAGTEAERAGVDEMIASLEEAKNAQAATIEAERNGVVRDRASAVQSLPEELVALYEKQRSRYGIGAGLLRGRISGGSNMALTESDLQVVREAAADDVLLCPDSGCILVRTEESGL